MTRSSSRSSLDEIRGDPHHRVLLKKLAVPPKDAQVVPGHAHISTTQQICTHVDEAAKRDAITRLNNLLGGAE